MEAVTIDRGARSVQGASWILIVTLLLSNVLGVIRDHFLAQKIATDQLDAYFAAFRIPDLLFNIIILGGITSAFIPIFTDHLSDGDRRAAWRVANSFLNAALLLAALTSLLLMWFHPLLTPYLVPHFTLAGQELTTQLGRLLLLGPLFFAISYVMGGVLNSFKHFVAYSMAPLLYNASIILFIVLLGDSFEVFAPAIGVIVGASLHMLVQLSAAIRLGYRWHPLLSFRDAALRHIVKLMIPRSIGLGLNQVLLLVFTMLGSSLASGSISAYNFALNIYTMPIVVFGHSFSTAIFPTLAEQISLNQKDSFIRYFISAFRAIVFLLVPATVGLILLRAQVVRLILGSGEFGSHETLLTLQVLGVLSLSMLPAALVNLLNRGYYATKNTLTPMWIIGLQTLSGIGIAYLLQPSFGVIGLAWAMTSSLFIQLGCLLFLIRRQLGLSRGFFVLPFLRAAVASAVMGWFVWLSLRFVAEGVDWRFLHYSGLASASTTLGLLAQLIIAIPVGAVSYLVVSRGLGSDELDWILAGHAGKRLEPVMQVVRLIIPYLGRRHGR